MKTKFPFTQLCTLAFLTMMSLSSFASNDGFENRSNVTPWLLNLDDDYSCVSAQRYYDGTMTLEGSLTQTMTACTNGRITQLHINGVLTVQGTNGNIVTVNLIDTQGTVVGESTTQWQQNMTHLQFEFTSAVLHEGEQYTIELTAGAGVVIEFNTVSNQQYFVGDLMLNGTPEQKNLCFIGLLDDISVELDDGTHDHGDVDHNIYDEYVPYGHDFHVKPPSEVEELRHSVYPNPFVAEFRVELDTDAQDPGTVTLYNFMGKKVFEQKLENISDSKFINVNPQTVLNKGYYTLRIEYGDNIILDTVVKN